MIDYLEIKGYKSIKNLELELKPINILIGSNGVGKSNFISFFKLINAIFNGRLQKYVLEERLTTCFILEEKQPKIYLEN